MTRSGRARRGSMHISPSPSIRTTSCASSPALPSGVAASRAESRLLMGGGASAMISRRELMATTTAVCVAGALGTEAAPGAEAGLRPLTTRAQPITPQERKARIDKIQGLMQQQKIGAFLVEAGSTLEYFTGVRWRT